MSAEISVHARRSMSRFHRAGAVALLIVLTFAGCSTSAHRSVRLRPVAVALTTTDTLPSAEQVEQIHEALKPQLSHVGLTLARKGEPTDFVVVVRFTQSSDPGGARATIMGIEATKTFREAGFEESRELKELRGRIAEHQRVMDRAANSSL